ncbi:MAG: metal-sensitive transcriptional regulator [Gemmatimonadales bacterium]
MKPSHATHVSPETKEALSKRLRRIEGQVRGLQRMIDEERYCADILVQIASAQEALRAVGKVLLRSHLTHCATAAIRSGDPAEAERTVSELVELFAKQVSGR